MKGTVELRELNSDETMAAKERWGVEKIVMTRQCRVLKSLKCSGCGETKTVGQQISKAESTKTHAEQDKPVGTFL